MRNLFLFSRSRRNTHEKINRDEDVKMGSERGFGLVFTTVFVIIAAFPIFNGEPLRIWAILIAIIFAASTLFAPTALRPLNSVWFKFGIILHRIMSPLIMGIIFFGAVLPTALVLRCFKHKLLQTNFEEKSVTYWISREQTENPADNMKRQF